MYLNQTFQPPLYTLLEQEPLRLNDLMRSFNFWCHLSTLILCRYHQRSSDSSGDIDVFTSESVFLEGIKEVILLLLKDWKSLAVFVEAGVKAFFFSFFKTVTGLEVDTKVCAKLVLAGNSGISNPVVMINFKLALEGGSWHLNSSDGLEGINVALCSRLSHIVI